MKKLFISQFDGAKEILLVVIQARILNNFRQFIVLY